MSSLKGRQVPFKRLEYMYVTIATSTKTCLHAITGTKIDVQVDKYVIKLKKKKRLLKKRVANTMQFKARTTRNKIIPQVHCSICQRNLHHLTPKSLPRPLSFPMDLGLLEDSLIC